jgi:hypothetical protein
VGLNVLFLFSQTIPIKRDIQCLAFFQISFESHFQDLLFFSFEVSFFGEVNFKGKFWFETLRIKGTCPSKFNRSWIWIFPIENSRFPTATLPSFTFSGKHHLSDE